VDNPKGRKYDKANTTERIGWIGFDLGGNFVTTLALWLIRFYQRFLSPHKGFRCAHAAFFGGNSCSGAIYTLVLERGFWRALPQIKIRFGECRFAYETLLRSGRISGRTRVAIQSGTNKKATQKAPRGSWEERKRARQERRKNRDNSSGKQACLPIGSLETALCCDGIEGLGDGISCCSGAGDLLEGCGSIGSCT
jgi:putative component of membrane protein insertase Oxa1/YidC/SpoIIIJ protein YidD